MPTVNQPLSLLMSSCYTIPPIIRSVESIDHYRESPQTMIPALAAIIKQHTREASNVDIKVITARLWEHYGKSNTDKSRKEFRILLTDIYGLISGKKKDPTVSDQGSLKETLSPILFDGLMNCNAGFQNRVIGIWQSLRRPSTFAERLLSLREQIVGRVAMQVSKGYVHAHNDVTKFASPMYGTRAINPSDPYGGYIAERGVATELENAFKKSYSARGIIDGIVEQLRSELSYKGYRGVLATEESYRQGEYNEFIKHLETVFSAQPVKPVEQVEPLEQWFLTPATDQDDHACNIIDINWQTVRAQIALMLIRQHYFVQPPLNPEQLKKLSLEDLSVYIEFFANQEERKDILGKLSFMKLVLCNLDASFLAQHIKERIAKLDSVQQNAILSQQATSGHNALMIAAQNNPSAVAPLLERIAQLTLEQQNIILSQQTAVGENALMLAAQNNPSTVAPLLERIAQLTSEQQNIILSQQTTVGHNALMLALAVNPSAVAPLLERIAQLTPEQQNIILSQQITVGHNALMLAARNNPSAVAPLLERIARLDDAQRNAILSQQATSGHNALMIALEVNPSAVAPLLERIAQLKPEQQNIILSQQTTVGHNALMLAAQLNPSAVAPLLERIAQLKPEQQNIILSQQTTVGHNALMLAAQLNPSAVAPLLERIARLDDAQRNAILSQQTTVGHNALMLAARNNPSAVAPLLIHIAKMSPQTAPPILKRYDITANLKPDSMMDVLKQIKELPNSGAVQEFILKRKIKFSDEQWYEIMKEELLPVSGIRKHKEALLRHVHRMDNNETKMYIINGALMTWKEEEGKLSEGQKLRAALDLDRPKRFSFFQTTPNEERDLREFGDIAQASLQQSPDSDSSNPCPENPTRSFKKKLRGTIAEIIPPEIDETPTP